MILCYHRKEERNHEQIISQIIVTSFVFAISFFVESNESFYCTFQETGETIFIFVQENEKNIEYTTTYNNAQKRTTKTHKHHHDIYASLPTRPLLLRE
jgi:hypothetical protein